MINTCNGCRPTLITQPSMFKDYRMLTFMREEFHGFSFVACNLKHVLLTSLWCADVDIEERFMPLALRFMEPLANMAEA